MNNIDIRLLRAFLLFMSERSVSRTSERLGLSQPAASHLLARLRVLFNDPLLLRSRAGMIPTDRATELEKSVRRMLEDYERMVTPPEKFDAASSQRRFVLSAPEYAEHLLIPPLLRALREQAPHVRIEVRAPQPERAYELLESGEVDLRIAWVMTPPLSLRSMQLFQDRFVCLVSGSNRQVQGALSLAQFLALPHVRPLGTGRPTTARVIDEAVEGQGHKLEKSFLVQNFLTIPFILAGTDMLATLPRMLAETFAGQHRLQMLEPPLRLPRIKYAAYWHERSQKDAGHKWLRSMLQDVARGLRD